MALHRQEKNAVTTDEDASARILNFCHFRRCVPVCRQLYSTVRVAQRHNVAIQSRVDVLLRVSNFSFSTFCHFAHPDALTILLSPQGERHTSQSFTYFSTKGGGKSLSIKLVQAETTVHHLFIVPCYRHVGSSIVHTSAI